MPTTAPTWIRQHFVALRALLVFTIILGIAYPLAVIAISADTRVVRPRRRLTR